ncbi:hypothetical protein VCR4J5_710046 [Vibrio crassostreae]|uniref:Uncharacterized protein n=1 Tax=Vibrio crassostreae TaxID=246167 RepID=A0A822MMT8_9VIBR|nr:hypothetical protein [Vibrio crassostreae]CDS95531.1 hypothetical protein VCR5J5_1160076 [Vibrio crassostreae]CDT01131.1 hypothetical protein VCR20J5_1100010 [Vibrio crassostreae]CDT02969.1 hypothetical protein VCR15J5_20063 [Vibrio crassostreae]CDT15750.1 hypothetical protein VCR19J5_1290010 [Vibrio crassostreae]
MTLEFAAQVALLHRQPAAMSPALATSIAVFKARRFVYSATS